MDYRHFASWPPDLPRNLAPADTTLHACLEATALRFADKPATIFQDEILSWAEVRARVHSLAGYLRAAGVLAADPGPVLIAHDDYIDGLVAGAVGVYREVLPHLGPERRFSGAGDRFQTP